jgi:hypothetical protein
MRGGPPAWGLGEVLTSPFRKKRTLRNIHVDTCGYGEELSSSINAGNLLTSCKVYWLASQEGLCSME